MKLDISFADFSTVVSSKGYTPKEQAKGNYVVMTNNKVKTEIKCNSGMYVVGYGLNADNLETVIDTLSNAGYILIERKKHQANFQFTDLTGMSKFLDTIETAQIKKKEVTAAAPKDTDKDTAKDTVKKSSSKSVKKKVELTEEEVAKIKEKNLATIKKVGKARSKDRIAEPTTPGVENFDPDEARQYVDEVTNDLDSFKAPSVLTMDEVNYLI